MGCASCAQKQQYAGMSRAFIPTPEVGEECHFTKEEIEAKKAELILEKETAKQTRLVRISYDIFRLNRALKNYDTNCNAYLKDLYELLS